MKFFTRYNQSDPVFSESGSQSLTQQQFKDEADINVILKRFQENPQPDLRTGEGPRVPLWGDFSSIPDVKSAHAIFQQAEASFCSLPSELRARFNNNPVEMLAFCESATPEKLKEVFGARAPEKKPEIIQKTDGVAAVNAETITKEV